MLEKFHAAYDDSLELQPRETNQAIYDGLCAALDAMGEVADLVTRLQRNLDGRDEYIVSKGLWTDFVAGLNRP
jgi:hypothetical protein